MEHLIQRKKKFYYFYDCNDKSKKILTTIGQLNFFKWAIDKKILEFVQKHLDDINDEMRQSTNDEKSKKKKKSKGKKKGSSSDSSSKSSKSTKEVKVKAKKTEEDDDVEIILHFM